MKKKLLAIALASLTLASCGEEKVDTNKDYATVIRETQSSVVSELTPDFEIVKEGTSTTDVTAKISAADNGNFNITGKMDSKYKLDSNESETIIELSGDANADGQSASGKLKASLSIIANTVYGKLDELSINVPGDEMSSAMIQGYLADYLNKWFSVKLDEETIKMLGLDSQKAIQGLKEFGELFAKTPLFDLVKENENETHYDYDVKLNANNLYVLLKNYYSIVGVDIPGTVKKDIEDGLKDAKIAINIKVNREDTSDFVITMVPTEEGQEGKVEFRNSKSEFIVDFNADGQEVKLVVDKTDSKNGITGKLMMKQAEKMIDLFTFTYKFDRLNTKVGFKMDMSNILPTGEEGLIDIVFDTKIKEEKVSLQAPSDSEDMTPIVAPFLEQMKMMNQMGGSSYYDFGEPEMIKGESKDMETQLSPEELEQLNKMMDGMDTKMEEAPEIKVGDQTPQIIEPVKEEK
ncbi:MAG: hypothetical protein N4A38_02775 [Candidatus Gracilibacteria bacterium]|nr:hypothetical protein [Candidatus Gracilibacteria bacterium]